MLGNFPPITLLSIEFKILADVLPKTLVVVVSSQIGEAQTCRISTRSIYDNLYRIRYIIKRPETKVGFDGNLINLDQLKVFDKVDFRQLDFILKSDVFSPIFRDWIAAMLSCTCSVVKANGHLSEPIGKARQSCSLLPPLYVLVLDPLLRKLEQLRSNPFELEQGRVVSV